MGITGFLVRRRNWLLAVMSALAVVCAVMIPRLNIIMELTYFLPDDSPMKLGMDRLERDFPNLDSQLSMLNVMVEDVPDLEEEEEVLTDLTGGMICASVRENPPYSLFEFRLPRDCDYKACKQRIEDYYGDRAVVEVTIDKNMPADIIPMILMGTAMVFIILFIMCSSLMEVLLFLITTLIAVVINMGSNILMEGVSYMTNTMVGVLQMILSMDYSIIVMNRYRQEKLQQAGNSEAMQVALRRAAPAILSSALTTIVSLLMLLFMHLKIGADLGVVLAKGVLLSMICNFTVLPGLILLFDKAIVATTKKVPQLPSNALSRFEVRWRVPLTIMFVGLFTAAFILQKRTEINFAAIWPTEINEHFPPQNPVILVYDTPEEAAVPGILDTLERDPNVISCLSYPSLMTQGYTASEMSHRIGQYSAMITEDLLHIVYYGYSHPTRNEKLSFDEIQDTADELARMGLMPKEFDTKSLMAKLTPVPVSPTPAPATPVQPIPEEPIIQDTTATEPADTLADKTPVPADSLAVAPETQAPAQENSKYGVPITYELATNQMTAAEISERFGIDRSYLNMLFRMAGRSRKPGTMSPYEITTFITGKILNDKRYASYITKEQANEIRDLHHQLDSAFIAGPAAAPVTDAGNMLLAETDSPADSLNEQQAAADSLAVPTPVQDVELTQAQPVEATQEPEPEITPLERLAEMAFSGMRYNSRRACSALAAAGVPVTQEEMDLLYLYAGSRKGFNPEQRMSINELISYVEGTLLADPALSQFVDEDSRKLIQEGKEELEEGAATMRSDNTSLAMVITDYDFESPQTFAFVERFMSLADRSLKGDHHLMGESVLYKEIKDEFPDELLLLTLLTVLAIFIIVAITFRSLIIPVMLVMAVMSGVYVNVFASGLGGNTMYFLSYLVVQSILMGATIDYSILFMNYYLEHRKTQSVPISIKAAYKGAGHSIMTSGLILTIAPYAMSMIIKDQMVALILKSLATGALSALLVIFLVQPGVIALCDCILLRNRKRKSFDN